MASVKHLLSRFFAFGAGLMMCLVFGIIFINSLRRYAIGESWAWGEELPVYLAIYGVMFGVALAYLQDRHIRFSVLTDLLPTGVQRSLEAMSDVAVAIAGAALAWSGWLFALRRGDVAASGLVGTARDLVEVTGIEALSWIAKVGTWRFALCVGGVLLAFAALARLSDRLSSWRGLA